MARRVATDLVRHVLIVGAGIGGLSAALALQRHGFRASLYERASAPNELGAGVLMTSNAIHGLNFLGVSDQIIASSNRSRGHEYRHYHTGEVLQRRPPRRRMRRATALAFTTFTARTCMARSSLRCWRMILTASTAGTPSLLLPRVKRASSRGLRTALASPATL